MKGQVWVKLINNSFDIIFNFIEQLKILPPTTVVVGTGVVVANGVGVGVPAAKRSLKSFLYFRWNI